MASQDILINWAPQETRVAIVENGAVQELHVERTLERGLVGNVYLGKVVRVLPGMQSAFIDIGLERAAFLHVADIWEARPHDGQNAPAIPIEKLLHDGQTITVQVIKDPIGTKGARLSTQISIAGRLLVFLPQDDHVGVSQKIPPAERDALRARLQALVGDKSTGGGGGFILRTNGEDSTDAELAEDIAYLRKTWRRIKESATRLPPASLIHQDLNLMRRVLRDLVCADTRAIRIDSREQFGELQRFAQEFMPDTGAKLALYTGERPLFDLNSVDEEISLGDFVLSGGEIAALALLDAVARLQPGVLGDEGSHQLDSFNPQLDGLLDCPHYTRPEVWEGRSVPAELLSGHHAHIELWRRAQRLRLTAQHRPDLLAAARAAGRLSAQDQRVLDDLA